MILWCLLAASSIDALVHECEGVNIVSRLGPVFRTTFALDLDYVYTYNPELINNIPATPASPPTTNAGPQVDFSCFWCTSSFPADLVQISMRLNGAQSSSFNASAEMGILTEDGFVFNDFLSSSNWSKRFRLCWAAALVEAC